MKRFIGYRRGPDGFLYKVCNFPTKGASRGTYAQTMIRTPSGKLWSIKPGVQVPVMMALEMARHWLNKGMRPTLKTIFRPTVKNNSPKSLTP